MAEMSRPCSRALVLAALLVAAMSPPARAQDTVAVRNAKIYTVSKGIINNGVLVTEGGKITAVGPQGEVTIPPDAKVIDAAGKVLMPGLVESHSHMGMKRLWVPADLDNNELSGPINSQLRGIDSIDTTDKAFRIALEAGITTLDVTPGSQTPNGGEQAILKLRGGTVDKMYYATGGMKFAMRTTFRERKIYPTTQMGVSSILREQLVAAQQYKQRWDDYTASGKQGPPPPRDMKLENMVKVITREWMVGVHAQSQMEMLNILRLAREFNLDLFFIHGTSLVYLLDEVLAQKVPVSFGPVLPYIGRESELLLGPVRYAQRGGKVCFQQDHPDGPMLYFRHIAAMCVRLGMPEDEALKALTINAAEIFRLQDRIGSLEVGKDADFLILSGEPLEIDTLVQQVFVEGKEVYNRSTGFSVF